jgi:hypothetical protein
MVTIALALILIAALAALAWYAWTSVKSASRGGSAACRGCPMAGECGKDAADQDRKNGADHDR